MGALCRRMDVPRLEVHETVSEAVAKLGGLGFGLVMRGGVRGWVRLGFGLGFGFGVGWWVVVGGLLDVGVEWFG